MPPKTRQKTQTPEMRPKKKSKARELFFHIQNQHSLNSSTYKFFLNLRQNYTFLQVTKITKKTAAPQIVGLSVKSSLKQQRQKLNIGMRFHMHKCHHWRRERIFRKEPCCLCVLRPLDSPPARLQRGHHKNKHV